MNKSLYSFLVILFCTLREVVSQQSPSICEFSYTYLDYEVIQTNISVWSLVKVQETDCQCQGEVCPIIVKRNESTLECYSETKSRSVPVNKLVSKIGTKEYCCSNYKTGKYGDCKYDSSCNNNNCGQICKKRQGTSYCECYDGFELSALSSTECDDIDECESQNGGCSQKCFNTEGSYHCACEDGYQLVEKYNCLPRSLCMYENGGCEQICVDDKSNVTCACYDGFVKYGKTQCLKNDTCDYHNGGCHHTCYIDARTNQTQCQCRKGYRLMDEYFCEDVDECLFNKGGCSHVCVNLVGTYKCVCPELHKLYNGLNCLEANISSTNFSNTDNGTLMNTTCDYQNGGCHHICIMNAKNNQSQCHCQKGYYLKNKLLCEDVDECSFNNGGCSYLCVNLPSSYKCECPDGFELNHGINCLLKNISSETRTENSSSEWNHIFIGALAGLIVFTMFILVIITSYFCFFKNKPDRTVTSTQVYDNQVISTTDENNYESLQFNGYTNRNERSNYEHVNKRNEENENNVRASSAQIDTNSTDYEPSYDFYTR